MLDCVRQLRLELHVKNKRDLAWVQDSAVPAPVYSAATKLGSAIKAAAASGVQVLYVDSVLEMEKIKKFHPSARFVIHYMPPSLFVNICVRPGLCDISDI